MPTDDTPTDTQPDDTPVLHGAEPADEEVRGFLLLPAVNAAREAARRPALGAAGGLPVVGDWNGDGSDDLGLFVPRPERRSS